MRLRPFYGLFVLVLFLFGCVSGPLPTGDALPAPESWVLVPLINESDAAFADQSAGSLLQAHLRNRGVDAFSAEQSELKQSAAQHVVTGRIVDWQYDNLARPKPKVTIDLRVYDLASQELLWNQQRTSTGGTGESIVSLADAVLARLVSRIDISQKIQSTQQNDDAALNAAVGQLAAQVDSANAINPIASAFRVAEKSFSTNDLPALRQAAEQYAPGGSIALYYAANPPIKMLNEFDRVVLEADAVSAAQMSEFNVDADVKSTLFAYLSVGEVGPTREWSSSIDKNWVLGENKNWNSSVMDMANPGWQAFLMSRAEELLNKGFQGFFLDTMDSYQLFAKTDAERQRQQRGTTSFIASLKTKYPNVQLIANRGFELLPSIATYLDVIAAESLYARWHGGSGGYQDVPEGDREWLLGQLIHARTNYGLEALSIDYVPPNQRDQARQVARKIAGHGIIPWVSTPGLDQMGVGLEEVFPREVLMLFDSRVDGPVEGSILLRFAAPSLDYLGYVPRYIDLANTPLPAGNLSGQYAGIVNWTESRYDTSGWSEWLMKQRNNGIPTALLGFVGAGIPATVLENYGLKSINVAAGTISVKKGADFVSRPVERIDFIHSPIRSTSADHDVQLSFTDKKGVEFDSVAFTSWGGYGTTPGIIALDPSGSVDWVIDPFNFFQKALQLADIPQPDVTTHLGRRIAMAHIDGDGLPSWAEMPGRRLGAEVLYEEIINPYKFPHSVSVVEAEMTEFDDFADRRDRMFALMRKMYKDDHVELATHTYSHPFKWDLLNADSVAGKYNLKIPGYQYSPEREIDGSIDFINSNLAPNGKKVEVVFWTGTALPNEDVLERVARLGLQNINGGNTRITRAFSSADRITPMIRPVGKYEQIYAPIMNENVYTNDWTGPFDGFRRVIETFEMTDSPKRLKPIGIYYHFYSGTKISSMRAMHEVYEWTIKQDIAPVFVSSYTKRVGEFRQAQVSRSIDGWWNVSGLNETQSIRWLGATNTIDVAGGSGVAGQRRLHDGLYIHPTSNGSAKFRQTDNGVKVPELVSSNGQITSWDKNGRTLNFRIQAEVPVELVLKNANGCRLQGSGVTLSGASTKTGVKFTFTQKDTGNVSLQCPA